MKHSADLTAQAGSTRRLMSIGLRNANERAVLHEKRIQQTYEAWLEGNATWPEVVALINARTPETVRQMEKAMGLE